MGNYKKNALYDALFGKPGSDGDCSVKGRLKYRFQEVIGVGVEEQVAAERNRAKQKLKVYASKIKQLIGSKNAPNVDCDTNSDITLETTQLSSHKPEELRVAPINTRDVDASTQVKQVSDVANVQISDKSKSSPLAHRASGWKERLTSKVRGIISELDDATAGLRDSLRRDKPTDLDIPQITLSADIQRYIDKHQGIASNVRSEIQEWGKTAMRTSRRDALILFANEQALVDGIKNTPTEQALQFIQKFSEQYQALPSVIECKDVIVDFSVYANKLNNMLSAENAPSQREIEALHHSLVRSLSESLERRMAGYEQRLIDESREQFLKKLYEHIEQFMQMEAALQPIIDFLEPGVLWDMAAGNFKNYGFDVLRHYAAMMANNEAILELAKLLGRQGASSRSNVQEMIEQTTVKSSYHPKPALVGDVVGFEYSGDVNRVVPTELGLLKNAETEMLFYTKLIEKRLLSYSFQQHTVREHSYTEEVSVSKQEPCGPIIACIDTSGSMHGAPEVSAKTLLLALAKEAIASHRKCYIISFSVGVETLDVSDFKNSNALDVLVGFLNKSFYGGNDGVPMDECLRKLHDENYKNADVVMVSDFILPALSDEMVSRVEKEKAKGTNFYSLVIGQSANVKALEVFTDSVFYNPYTPEGRKEFARKVRCIAQRQNAVL